MDHVRILWVRVGEGGKHSTMVTIQYLLTDQAALGLIPSIPEIFSVEKLSMLLRLISSNAWRKVYSGFKDVDHTYLCVVAANAYTVPMLAVFKLGGRGSIYQVR